MDNDFKDLEEKEYHVEKKHLLVILITSILITLIYQFNIKGYFFEAMLPFILILLNYLIIFKDAKKNKKAYYLLIPMSLIMISDLIVGIDAINKDLNLIILPIILSIFIFSLLNKNYDLKGNALLWFFKLFPVGLFSNLKHFKLHFENTNTKKITNILTGVGFGICFGAVIIYLLIKADDYFGAMLNSIFKGIFNFNINYIVIFVISFILIFSILINILKHQEDKVNNIKVHSFDKTIIITFLTMINLVFMLFLLSEISRLTTNFLQLPVEYTYSSYAREGFFELLFVTMINYAIIMFLLYKTDLVKKEKVVRIMLMLLIGFSCLLIFNSYYRMYLYINHYGFTILRMQVILFLLMELIFFILMMLKIFNKFNYRNALVYFVIAISFYIINLYLCNNTIIG